MLGALAAAVQPLALGIVGLAEALPAISMSLFAGHVADSHDRRRIALWALSLLVLCSVGLWWLAHPAPIGDVALTAPARVRAIYAVIVLSGLARAFLQPARQALSAELVRRYRDGQADVDSLLAEEE